ncbi:hypothetical protein Dvar_43350 [Desulfosarcina variabilis str. Montpellier]|jgi:predicted transcriptional regulator|uniref:hypothetical protein n=1 Tax=Desulfosarcina variabilis TaxID=2300 RepID=UPI003AFAA353
MQKEPSASAKKKDAMKALRKTRAKWVANASEKVKQQRKALKGIRGQLAGGAATVPEIAQATGMQTAEVLWYLAALKKYGEIVEAQKDGSYFRYVLTPKVKS